MASRIDSLLWAGVLVAALAAPLAASAQDAETDLLPSYAAEELEAARAAQNYDPVAEAQAIPPPPNGVSRAQAVPEADRDRGDVGFDDFYNELSDYGSWVETPEYGYVFVPARQAQVNDWRPYTYGRWIWTDYGWTWASDEPFGWATYHYGRWTFSASFGWAWVPGYTWGPAWVAWRYGDSAIGWAPLYPGYVSYTASYPVYTNHWVFIGPTFFYSYPVHQHHYRWDRSAYYHRHTHWASNWRHGSGHSGHVYAGPPRTYVERHTRAPVRRTEIRHAASPGRDRVVGRSGTAPREVAVYRPERSNRPQVDRSRLGQGGAGAPRNLRAQPGVGSGLVRPQANRATPQRIDSPGTIRTPSADRSFSARERSGQPAVITRPNQSTPDRMAPQRGVDKRSQGTPERAIPAPKAQPAPRAGDRAAPGRISPATPSPQKVGPGTAPRTAPGSRQIGPANPAPSQRSAPAPQNLAPNRSAPVQRRAPAPQRLAPGSAPVQRSMPAPQRVAPTAPSASRFGASPNAGPSRSVAPQRSAPGGGSQVRAPQHSIGRSSAPSAAPRASGHSGGGRISAGHR